MHLSFATRGLALSFAFLSAVLATPTTTTSTSAQANSSSKPSQTFPTPSTSACYTDVLSTQKERPATKWSTWTTSCTQTSTSTVTSTKVPVVTTTSTVLTTSTRTAAPTTKTATVTSTAVSTTTTTTTSITTFTATSTTVKSVLSTSTVPTTSSFKYVETSLSGGVLVTNQRSVAKNKQKRLTDVGASVKRGTSPGRGSSAPFPSKFGDVACHKYIGQYLINTVTTTVTYTAPTSTSTVTSTSTIFTTTTPGASTTITTTTTRISTATSTAIRTTTKTVTETTTIVSTTTYYQACATGNQGTFVYNEPISSSQVEEPTNRLAYTAAGNASAYDCCVQGILNPGGSMYIWYNQPNPLCVIAQRGACPTGGQFNGGTYNYIFYQNVTDNPYTLGNLNCGRWYLPYSQDPQT